jgi:hypothetical protein
MACAKASTLSAKDHFSVSTEDYSTARLRKREIKMRRKAATDWC